MAGEPGGRGGVSCAAYLLVALDADPPGDLPTRTGAIPRPGQAIGYFLFGKNEGAMNRLEAQGSC